MKPFLVLFFFFFFFHIMAFSEDPLTIPFQFLSRIWADCITFCHVQFLKVLPTLNLIQSSTSLLLPMPDPRMLVW